MTEPRVAWTSKLTLTTREPSNGKPDAPLLRSAVLVGENGVGEDRLTTTGANAVLRALHDIVEFAAYYDVDPVHLLVEFSEAVDDSYSEEFNEEDEAEETPT
jgi:hypothetical protein